MNPKKPATLKSYGRAFHAISMSAAADQRIRRALEGQAPRTRTRAVVSMWALPVVAVCGLLLWLEWPGDTTTHACDVARESTDTRYAGRCDVELRAMTVRLAPDATFVEHERDVALAAGTAHFSVRKVAPGEPPVRVRVPGASIVVLGTEFTVTVTDQTSRVSLLSGHVQFVHDGRGAVDMRPGQQLTFEAKTGKTEVVTVSAADASTETSRAEVRNVAPPEPSSPSPATESTHLPPSPPPGAVTRTRSESSPRTPNGASSADAPSSDLQAALELRAQGRYEEALVRLERVTPQGSHAREVVDFEQATLTELQTPSEACVRYRQHLARFPSSRYRAAVLQKLARCDDRSNNDAPLLAAPKVQKAAP